MCIFNFGVTQAKEQSYSIDINVPDKEIKTGHLKLGGINPIGGELAFNSFYMEENGIPMIAVMGEIHYARIPHETWEEEILKMKSGGINVIATYVFWSLHEEEEGVFNWTGDRNLRGFLDLCKKHEMKAIVRIGPFCHGEIRNGGIPDWLYGRTFQIRTNDDTYLTYVSRYWDDVAKQLKGTYYQDGGTVIGIQLENELQHSASPWGFSYPGQPFNYTTADYDVDNTHIGVAVAEKPVTSTDLGEKHMATLKALAASKGIKAPLYTATGWGYAAIMHNECVPVTSCYPYNWWETQMSPSSFFLFKDLHKSPDYSPVRYNPEDYPSFSAEIGVGCQLVYHRREVPAEGAAEAIVVRALGSGSNGVGYYMYHGGTTPRSKSGFFSDEPMGVPKMSYDFVAPLGEFGYTRDSYHQLRLIHSFVTDFGALLAPMGTVLPKGYEIIKPTDTNVLRYAVRKKGNSGFIFLNNFQDHAQRHDLEGVSISVITDSKTLRFPSQGTMTVRENISAILPFNLNMEGAILEMATVQPLAKIVNGSDIHYFFFANEGMTPEFVFNKLTVKSKSVIRPVAGKNSTVKVKTVTGKTFLITTLTRQEALTAYKLVYGGAEKLVLTTADLMQHGSLVRLQEASATINLTVFPANKGRKYFSEISFANRPIAIEPQIATSGDQRFEVRIPEKAFEGVSDLRLVIDYVGDTMAAFIDGKMVTDHFYTGTPWILGLKRFKKEISDESKNLYFYIQPAYENASWLSSIPTEAANLDFSKGNIAKVSKICIVPEYKAEINLFK